MFTILFKFKVVTKHLYINHYNFSCETVYWNNYVSHGS